MEIRSIYFTKFMIVTLIFTFFQMIWGQYCECDNFSCDRRNNTVCSGHGTCNCGTCECAPGWKGDACECSTDTNSCVKHGLECSGHVSLIEVIFYQYLLTDLKRRIFRVYSFRSFAFI